ncbi:short chain dehydrogenase [Echinicola jeungdonensis]|uniref:Short chain dehydrogenase n=1 Tax=Echinicola jeungdonensis TaxID=709343 RepID=A0ABV5J4C0_9BACT|nr:short chain dehydrogenase [Echinicola jeungdonensis]MDN3667889.1 short chain dehydrogenase [Echinicola jeungdonensis]
MKILLVGGQGTIGKKIKNRLAAENEVITAGRNSGDIKADMTDPKAVEKMFEKVGKLDAVIVTAGSAPAKPLKDISYDDFMKGVQYKMMGQIHVAMTATKYLNKGGSVTLTSGILAEDPIPHGTVLSTVNSAVNGFVIGAYGDFLKLGYRLNVVSPPLVADSAPALARYFPGHTPAPMSHVVDCYIKSLKTLITGQVIKVGVN